MSKFIRSVDIIYDSEKFRIIGIVDALGHVCLSEAELALLYIEIHKILFKNEKVVI